MAESTDRGTALRSRSLLLVGGLALALLLCFLQWRGYASALDSRRAAVSQLERMRADAERIEKLRDAPRTAASRPRANEELLAQIEGALDRAGIARDQWRDSIPQPELRLPKSDYVRHATRIRLEGVSLRQLAAFAHHLQTADPTLWIESLTLTNRDRDTDRYDSEASVAYLVFAPTD